jgi:hypothetical protein
MRNTQSGNRLALSLLALAVVCALTTALLGCDAATGNGNTPNATPSPIPTPTPAPTPMPTPTPTPTPPPAAPLLPADQPRFAFQSGCAQNVLACESSRPLPVIEIEPGPNQFVTISDDGIVIVGESADEIETVKLIGSGSVPGTGFLQVTYSWSRGATDTDPATLTPGPEFSREAEVEVRMAKGFHYVRLTVHNGSDPPPSNPSPSDLDTDFRERQIEIRIAPSNDFAPRTSG